MAKIKSPATLSDSYQIDAGKLDKLGVFNPTLAVDTRLFIDPLLFQESIQPEMRDKAVKEYRKHFEMVIKLLAAIRHRGDVVWRSARKKLEFHEIRGTCLGYGAGSIYGSGFGNQLTDRIFEVGREIVGLGIRDPDLFAALALFEADIGPDRISDMATNVILGSLIEFNRRILGDLNLVGEDFRIMGIHGTLLRNPFQSSATPIILIPKDILRKLPIASDWDEIADAASENEALRSRVNEQIGHIWEAKTKRDKAQLRAQVLASKEAFETFLDVVRGVPRRAYSVDNDPDRLIKWASVAKEYASAFPLDLSVSQQPKSPNEVYALVIRVVQHFRHLIEHNGLNKELYKDKGRPRHESTAQRLFFAIAHCYCAANNVDLSPEVDSGSGQVDFKFSKGFTAKVLVEIKLSTNPKLVQGYKTQLETYKKAEGTMRAIYLVIDVGNLGNKDELLTKVKNSAAAKGSPLSHLEFVDGTLKVSASKR